MRGKEAPAGWRGKGRRSSCRVALRASEEDVEFLLSQREVPEGRLPRGGSRGGAASGGVALRASEEDVEFLLSQREVPVGRLPRGGSRGGPVELPREDVIACCLVMCLKETPV